MILLIILALVLSKTQGFQKSSAHLNIDEVYPKILKPNSTLSHLLTHADPAATTFLGTKGKLIYNSALPCYKDVKFTLIYPADPSCQNNPNQEPYERLPTVYVCFDYETATTHFTFHMLFGASMLQNTQIQNRVAIKRSYHGAGFQGQEALFESAATMVGYDLDFIWNEHETKLTNLLGKTNYDHFNGGQPQNKQLSRGHLTPKSDFVGEPKRTATNFYINTAPQWGGVNGGNWQKIEEQMRMLVTNEGISLQVYTGTMGILQLPNSFGVLVDIYMDGNRKWPVPKFFWKLVVNHERKFAAGFIQLNNPFVERQEALQEMPASCSNQCQSMTSRLGYGLSQESKDPKKGYTHCCTYKEFKAALGDLVPYLPYGDDLRLSLMDP